MKQPKDCSAELDARLNDMGFTTTQRIWLKTFFSHLSETPPRNRLSTRLLSKLCEKIAGELAETAAFASLAAGEVRACTCRSKTTKKHLLALELAAEDFDRWMRIFSAFSGVFSIANGSR
jgi:hypothetical protein